MAHQMSPTYSMHMEQREKVRRCARNKRMRRASLGIGDILLSWWFKSDMADRDFAKASINQQD